MATEMVYYKKNVPYTVVVRRHNMDSQGYSLNNIVQWIGIPVDDVRDFKIANKHAIIEGIIIPTATPLVDWETPNALTDEDINEILKVYAKLKSTLKTIDSISTLSRLLEAAKIQDKPDKTRQLIKDRLVELGEEDDDVNPSDMMGVSR